MISECDPPYADTRYVDM